VRIGVDLGGTKIEGIAIGDDGGELSRYRIPTPQESYESVIATIVSVVARLEHEAGQTGSVGVGTPGAISPATGLIKNANSTKLNGRPLDRDLATALGRQVRLANDANCFALSEAVDGAGAGYASVFGVILGTGVGGGIVINRKLVDGPNAIAGEWGHNPMPWPTPDEWPGPPCYCGRTGCIETFLSGPGLALNYNTDTGRDFGARQVQAAAESGDTDAEAAV
jgi:fructokinase